MDTDFFKQFLLALFLCVVVLVVFQRWLAPTRIPTPPPAAVETTAPAPMPSDAPSAAAVATASVRPETTQPIVSEEVTTVETERFLIKLSNLGGSIKEIKLKDHHPQGQPQEPLPLVSLENPEEYGLAVMNLFPAANLAQVSFRLERPDYATYIYKYTTPDGISLSKKYTFSQEAYLIETELNLQNNSSQERTFKYQISTGSRISGATLLEKRFVDVISLAGGKVFDLRQGMFQRREEFMEIGGVSWVALRNSYFCLMLVPLDTTTGGYRRAWKANREKIYAAGLEPTVFTLSPGAGSTHEYLFYAGPQDTKLLSAHGVDLEKIVFFGKLDGICKVVLRVLDFLYRAVGNYGLAIILLTLLMNLVLFPLTRHSQGAMMKNQEKMKTVQAKVAQLKEKHANNPQKLNQETMALYRKHGINPLAGGGCLTMILQMPIFIALYITLAKAFELRGATFLWIQDLSQPDAAFRLNFTIPLLKTNAINVLPILAALVMIVQQKMTTASQTASLDKEQRQQQKMMSVFFTIFLGFIFYNFPAGLNLYFLTNMACMVGIQGIIRGQLKALGQGGTT